MSATGIQNYMFFAQNFDTFLPWGMIDILFRKWFNPMSEMLILSIKIFPVGSESLNRAVISDDFPAPVLPTIPIFSFSLVLKLIFFRIFLEFPP